MRKFFLSLFFISGLLICTTMVQGVTFTSDTLIDTNNFTYDGNDIIVDGCVLTINGQHQFNSLQIINAGVLTHSAATAGQADYKIDLTITQDITIATGCFISADSKGYGSNNGLGAGGNTGGSGGGASYGG